MADIPGLIASSGSSIGIETELTAPQLVAVEGGPNPFVAWLKPRVTVIGPSGVAIFQTAPYGNPDPGKRLLKQAMVGAIVIGAFGIAFMLGRKSR